MSAPRVLRARYADWRPVKGRKVLQLIFEVPLEQQEEALTMLGAPLPDRDMWAAIARLEEGATIPRPAAGKLAQRAGILCSEGAFRRFMRATTEDEAAAQLRQHCGVASRREFDTDPRAARVFNDLVIEYENWMRGIAA